MLELIPVGTKGHAETTVVKENCAALVGSGSLDVFATPCMTALMEQAAYTSLLPFLEEGQGTVGTKLDVSHVSATPIGMKVRAESEVTAVDGKKISFRVQAFDEAGLIGEGVHERFIIAEERFLQKCCAKLDGRQ